MQLRELRFTSPEIAETLGMPLSTVGAVLSRHGMGQRPRPRPDEPANSYERVPVGACLPKRGDVKRLRLPNPTWCYREESGEHVRGGNQSDCVHGDRNVEGGHEDDVDADATAVRGARRKRHVSRLATPVAEDGEALLAFAPLLAEPRLQLGQNMQRITMRERVAAMTVITT